MSSKPSRILICPVVALGSLPDSERDVLRRFFTEHVRGMDRENDRTWRRFIRELFNADPGEGFQLYLAEERSGPYHRMHRMVLERLFDHQDRFTDIDVLHDWLKLKCWFVAWKDGKPYPRSTAFDKCSEAEIRIFHDKMADLLHAPWAQRYFWPDMPPPWRHQMAELVLTNKGGEEQQQSTPHTREAR